MKLKNTALLLFLSFQVLCAQGMVEFSQAIRAETMPIGTWVTWSTAWENNLSLFMVERSTDGLDFQSLGNIESAGVSMKNRDYNFLDATANLGKVYYRLQMIGKDGSVQHSTVTSLEITAPNNMVVITYKGAAVSESLTMTIDSQKEGLANMGIASLKGEVLYQEMLVINSGINELTLPIENMPIGGYEIFVMMEGERESLMVERIQSEEEKRMNVASKNTIRRN